MIDDHGMDIRAALARLALTAEERETAAALPGVRTLGDLLVALERGAVEKALAAKITRALKA